ncbi:MAG: hypothetical protein RR313_05980 [Anaerovoracaceae bacterium]
MGYVKVREVNLERGMPTVPVALNKMVNELSTAKMSGQKAVILVHGYGSSGVGGGIKVGVKAKLKEPYLSGIIRKFCGGEQWMDNKKDFLTVCPQLKDFSSYVDGNKGITIVLLK